MSTELIKIRAELQRAQSAINAAFSHLESLEKAERAVSLALVAKPKPESLQDVRARLEGSVVVTPEPTIKVVESAPSVAPDELVINDEWKTVLALLNDGTENVFVTGEAGTGKTTLMGHFTSNFGGRAAIVAPTGVAALRANGETIHRFFGFGAHAIDDDDIRLLEDSRRRKFKALDVLIIDEISMVRADLMDGIDKFLRKNGRDSRLPFGGCRIVMFGDLFQLPPVSKEKDEKRWLVQRYGTETPYFFHAECWRKQLPHLCNLTTIFRQKDSTFTNALNAVRKGEITREYMAIINSQVNPAFKPPQGELWLTLTTTNDSANQANQRMLRAIEATSKTFEATVIGDFDLKNAPTDESLELKPGAAVMFVRNHTERAWVNGTLGTVSSLDPLKVEINGVLRSVDNETWEAITYEFDEKKNTLKKAVKGSFTQIPMRLASAITIHKSQGMTFDRCIVDLGGGAFAAGQAYVALSRCRTLEGMILRRPLQERDLITSNEVQAFMAGKPIAQPKPAQLNIFEVGS